MTWDAPAQVVNDGTVSANGTLTVNNSGAGHAAIGPHVVARLTVSGIGTLNCANITLTGDLDWTTLTGAGGNCTEDITFSQGTTNASYDEFLNVDQGVTGTLTSTIAIIQRNVSDTADLATLGTSTDTTTVANGSAPTFTGAAVPAAIVYHNYSFQFGTNQGFPTLDDAIDAWSGYAYAFGTHLRSNGTYRCTTSSLDTLTVNGSTHTVIWLSDDFYYDVTTGALAHDGVTTETNSVRYWTWTIVENNDEGGASAAAAGTACDTTAVPTPNVQVHDVLSHPFTTPVIFSDVSLASPFASEIYALSDSGGVINGFADGTFRPTLPVSRQAFAAFLARDWSGYFDDGPCSAIHPSIFSDVPNSSPFCRDITSLAQAGIITGYSDGKFHPAASITRQAAAAFFYRLHAYIIGATVADAVCTTPVPFNDVSTSNPFCGDIEFLNANGIANGFADGGFHPAANITRQATAALLVRFDTFED